MIIAYDELSQFDVSIFKLLIIIKHCLTAFLGETISKEKEQFVIACSQRKSFDLQTIIITEKRSSLGK